MSHDNRSRLLFLFFSFLLASVILPESHQLNDAQANEHSITSDVGQGYTESCFETADDDFSIPIDSIDDLADGTFSGVLYFSRATCPFCQMFNVSLKQVVESDPTLVVYEFDTDIWRSDAQFQTILDQYGVDSIPNVVKVYPPMISHFCSEADTQAEFVEDLRSFLTASG